jgi:hypothetical protein
VTEGSTPADPEDPDYGNLTPEGQRVLNSYLNILQDTDPTALPAAEQRAYWMNLYNAASLAFVLDEFGRLMNANALRSGTNRFRRARLRVKDFMTDSDSPWRQRTLTVNGTRLSLDDIEHRILYAFWPEPLTLYGLYCPARGCPVLWPEPFEGHRVEDQLARAARAFIADGDNVKLRGGRLEVSRLYRQQGALFGGDAGVIEHLRAYGPAALRERLAGITQIGDDDFSWKLAGDSPEESWKVPQGTFSRGANNPGIGF